MIAFPKLHIAESVLNRISNALEESGPLGVGRAAPVAPAMVQPEPIPPNPLATGVAVEQALQQPPAEVAVAPEQEEAANSGMLEAASMGMSLFDGALVGAAR